MKASNMMVLKWMIAVSKTKDDKPNEIGGGKVVHVEVLHDDPGFIQVWTEEYVNEDGECDHAKKPVGIYPTGVPIDRETTPLHIGSTNWINPVTGFQLVWHVYSV